MEVILKGKRHGNPLNTKIVEMVKKIVFFIYVQSVNLYHIYFEL